MTTTLQPVPDAAPPVALPSPMALPELRMKFTREGKAMFREVSIPTSLDYVWRNLWKTNRLAFMERGFTLRCENSKWYLVQWLNAISETYTLTAIGQEKLDALRQPSTEMKFAAPEPEAPPELPPLPPELEAKLFDYQVQPARQLLNAVLHGTHGYPGAWDCSGLGTGKSFMSLAAALATSLEVAVIAPLSVIPAWKGVFRHFGHRPRFVLNYESLRTGKRDYVKIEHYTDPATGRKGRRFDWKVDPLDTILLFDEAQRVKAPTQTQALAIAAIRQRFHLIMISGTLAVDPTHMRATGRAVGLHAGGKDYYRFLIDHGCSQITPTSYEFRGGKTGRHHLARIHRAVFPNRGARIRVEDLGDKFPETTIIAEAFETGATQTINEAFKEAQKSIERLEAQGISEGQLKMLRGTTWMKAFHESERIKIPLICEKVSEEMEAGRSVAVFLNFTDVREDLMRRLKTGCAVFGGQPPAHREKCIADFQADKSRIILCNIDAGGVGVSLHDLNGNHPRTALIMPTTKVVSITQALGRVHRAGGKSKSRQIILFSAGFEETLCRRIRAKISQISALNDGDLSPETAFDGI